MTGPRFTLVHQRTPRDGEEGCQLAARAVLKRAPRFPPLDLGIGIVTTPPLACRVVDISHYFMYFVLQSTRAIRCHERV